MSTYRRSPKPYKEIIDIVEEFMEHKDKELTEKAHKDYMDHMESKDNPTTIITNPQR